MVPNITSNKIPMEISIDHNLEVQLQTEKNNQKSMLSYTQQWKRVIHLTSSAE